MRFQRLRHFTSTRDVLIFFSIPLVWISLPLLLLFPLEQVLGWLTPSKISSSSTSSSRKIFRFAGYWFSRKYIAAWNSCLKKSLVLYYFLNRYGTPATISIGVKKDDGRLTGHSWLEHNGMIIGESRPADDFIMMYRYPK